MKIGNLVPVCGSTKRRPSKATYHRFSDEDEYYSQGRTSISMLQPIIPTLLLQPKLRLSTSFLKRFRDAYVDAMLCFAERAVHFNNGEVFFLKKIQDDDVRYLTASLN